MGIDVIILLFPIVFMVHELEEILFVKAWATKNKNKPGINKQYWVVQLTKYPMSTATFAALVAEEFVIISFLTLAAVGWNLYAMFAGLLIAYALHLLKHIGDMIRWRRYVPGGPTALLTLPVIVWMISVLLSPTYALNIGHVLLWTVVLGVLLILNLKMLYKISPDIEKYS